MSDLVETHLNEMQGLLTRYSTAIAAGERVDLTDLDKRMGELCVTLVNNRPESTAHVPRLKALIAQLEQLSADLARQNGQVS